MTSICPKCKHAKTSLDNPMIFCTKLGTSSQAYIPDECVLNSDDATIGVQIETTCIHLEPLTNEDFDILRKQYYAERAQNSNT